MRSSLLAVALVLSVHAVPSLWAQEDPITYTRFLVPLYQAPVAGAYGSLWEVNTWIHYAGQNEAQMVPRPVCYAIQCILLEGQLGPETPVLPFHLLGATTFPSGVVVHVDQRYASAVTFASRVRDLSRQRESAGTEVPVIREDRLLSLPRVLLNVPVAPRYRNTLRVYALPEVPNPEVEVRYFRQPEDTSRLEGANELLRRDRVPLATYPEVQNYKLHPSGATIGNFETFAELLAEDEIWIEIVPLTPGLRIWAMVSVTNNETQQITLITPGGR